MAIAIGLLADARIVRDVPPQVFGWGGVVLAALMILLGLRAGRRKRLVDNIPTSKTTGVFIGFVEVKGAAESERPLCSCLAEAPCRSAHLAGGGVQTHRQARMFQPA